MLTWRDLAYRFNEVLLLHTCNACNFVRMVLKVVFQSRRDSINWPLLYAIDPLRRIASLARVITSFLFSVLFHFAQSVKVLA